MVDPQQTWVSCSFVGFFFLPLVFCRVLHPDSVFPAFLFFSHFPMCVYLVSHFSMCFPFSAFFSGTVSIFVLFFPQLSSNGSESSVFCFQSRSCFLIFSFDNARCCFALQLPLCNLVAFFAPAAIPGPLF